MTKEMSKLFWRIAAYLGFWIPCSKYLPDPKYFDWVLISVKDALSKDRGLPHIVEYSSKRTWDDASGDRSINEWLNDKNLIEVTHWRVIPYDKHLK